MRSEEFTSRSEEYKKIITDALNDPKKRDLLSEPDGLKQLLGITEQDLEDLWREAQHYSSVNEDAKAVEPLFYLITFEPYQPEYYIYAGSLLVRMKRYQDAQQLFTSAALLKPDDPSLPLYIGRCKLAVGKTEEAKLSFQDCIDLARVSSDPDAHRLMTLADSALKECKDK